MTDYAIREAHVDTIHGLIPLIPNVIEGCTDKTSPENLRWMLDRCLDEILTLPVDKIGRWVGFVQGVLALSGNLDVDEERNRTRPFFHKAYQATNQDIPKTMEMKEERVETRVVGHREAHYPGEPKSRREIKELVNFPPLELKP